MEDLRDDDLLPTNEERDELGMIDLRQTTGEPVGDPDSEAEPEEMIE